MDHVTTIIYSNSTDDSFALRINFEKIHGVIAEINQHVDNFSLDFTEWLMDNYIKIQDEYQYTDITKQDSTIYNIEELLVKFKNINLIMITAKEAREKTAQSQIVVNTDAINTIQKAIHRAIDNGEYECTINIDINSYVNEFFKSRGYVLTYHDGGRNDYYYQIKW